MCMGTSTAALFAAALLGAAALAQQPPAAPPPGTLGDGSPPESFYDSLFKGKVSLNIRARYEYADAEGSLTSNAQTLRTRLGYGTAPYRGLSFFGELEDIRAADEDRYDPNRINDIPPRTFISDPVGTELNQAFVKYDTGWRGTVFTVGRQRINLDDQRFIGSVAWRQNEQTFDAVRLDTDFGSDDWAFTYAYLMEVNRVFGNESQDGLTPTGYLTRDFDSDSHLFNLAYNGLGVGKITGFAYLLDLTREGDGFEGLSSNTFGVRLDGSRPINDELTLGYVLSYARQTDAAGNGTDYDADYYLAEASIAWKKLGKFTGGYELLGADGDTAAFRTPLATLHKFQGWSDVLLAPSLAGTPVGAGAGIEDFYLAFTPNALPLGLEGQVVYHFFFSDTGSLELGRELDIVLSKKINRHLTLLTKYANYDAEDFGVDTQVFWLEATFAF